MSLVGLRFNSGIMGRSHPGDSGIILDRFPEHRASMQVRTLFRGRGLVGVARRLSRPVRGGGRRVARGIDDTKRHEFSANVIINFGPA